MKYLITDPCYIVPDEEWRDFLDETVYTDAQGRFNYWWPFAKMPRDLGHDCRMIVVSDIPDGDISFGYGNQEFAADAGSVCICEVPDDFIKPEHNLGVVVDTLTDAEFVFNVARSHDSNLPQR